MPLNPSPLVSSLAALFLSGVEQGTTPDQTAAQLAAAYHAYAASALSCGAHPPSVVNLAGLRAGLAASMANLDNTPAGAAAGWRAALDAYWAGAKFSPTGTVVSVGGGGGLESALTNTFANTDNSAGSAAQQIGSALDSYTRTVTVADTIGMSPCVAPVS